MSVVSRLLVFNKITSFYIDFFREIRYRKIKRFKGLMSFGT